MNRDIINMANEIKIFIKKIYLFQKQLPEIADFYRDATDNESIKSIEAYFLAHFVRRLDKILEEFKEMEANIKLLKKCYEVKSTISKKENNNG